MSGKTWLLVSGFGVLWFVVQLFFGFPGFDAETSMLKQCIAEKHAADQQGFGNVVYDQNSGGMVRIEPDHTEDCAGEIMGSESTHRQLAFLATPLFFLIAGGVHAYKRRKSKEAEDAREEEEKHQEVINAVTAQTRTEIIMGDVYKNINNSNLIVRSTLREAIQTNDIANPDLSVALGEIAKIVANSSNKDAADHLNHMTAELAKPEPNKSLLRTLWTGLKELVPLLKETLEVRSVIDKFIS